MDDDSEKILSLHSEMPKSADGCCGILGGRKAVQGVSARRRSRRLIIMMVKARKDGRRNVL
jgi:hypothetical protein